MGDPNSVRQLLPELATLPGHLFWRAQARVASALGEVLPPGVDIHAYAALLALSGGITRSQQGLAETISVSRTTMVRVAADLSSQGLVRRVRNPADRRSYALTRTPEGAAAARRWRRHAEDLEDTITSGFTLTEREELRGLLFVVAQVELAPDVPEPLRESIAFLVTRIHNRMHREFMVALEPLRIEPRDFGTLVALCATGPVSQAELARHMGVSGASMVQIVDDLEHRGLAGAPSARERPPDAGPARAPRGPRGARRGCAPGRRHDGGTVRRALAGADEAAARADAAAGHRP